MGETYLGRLGLQQRVLPSYRAAFLDALAEVCQRGLSVFAGKPLSMEGIQPVDQLQIAQFIQAKNRYFLDPSSSMFVCWQGGFLRWLEEWQPDGLIVEANPRYPVTRQAIAWMHQKGRKVIGWGLGAPPIGGPFSGLRRRERLSMLHSLDALIAYSKQGAEQYRQLGFPPERVYVASNAVASAPLFPPPPRTLEYNGQANVLFVGRLQSRKRVDLLIQACAALPVELQPHVVVVGEGPAHDELIDLAEKIYPSVEFIGAKHGAELEPHFAKADLFVLPGTGGLAIQQAMAHGLPVVVAHGDGTQDDLVGAENGWQVPPDDLDALTNILRRALSDPVMLRQMGEVSYRIVAEEINIDKMVEVFIHALNDISKGEKGHNDG
jgi:glycosyltransferase involved in cell wall biosynthesis